MLSWWARAKLTGAWHPLPSAWCRCSRDNRILRRTLAFLGAPQIRLLSRSTLVFSRWLVAAAAANLVVLTPALHLPPAVLQVRDHILQYVDWRVLQVTSWRGWELARIAYAEDYARRIIWSDTPGGWWDDGPFARYFFPEHYDLSVGRDRPPTMRWTPSDEDSWMSSP